MTDYYPTDDYYPTEEDVETIKNWDYRQPDWQVQLMAYIKNHWWMPDWGWKEQDAISEIDDKPIRRYHISTGGWSGNEILIDALQANHVFWMLTWVQTRRGGHYIFEIRKENS